MPQQGYRYLICHILLQTFSDLKVRVRKGGRRFQSRQEALSFLDSEWFNTLCYGIDLEPSFVKEELLKSSSKKQFE